jgi:hypothetical protein
VGAEFKLQATSSKQNKNRIKVKCALEQAMKALRECGGIALLFL